MPAQEVEKKPATLDVLLPEDAVLEVDGYKAKATGELRHFQSPPLVPGHMYAYSIQVTWHGRTLTRRVRLKAGELTKVDLRQELQTPEPPTPVGSFSLLVPPAMTLPVGQSAMLPLRIKRFHFPDPIRISFPKLLKGVMIEEVTLAAGETETKTKAFAALDAPQVSGEINVLARSGASEDASTMNLTITRGESIPQTKPKTQPIPKPEAPPETKPEIRLAPKPEIKVETKQEQKPESKPAPIPITKPDEPRRMLLRLVMPDKVELEAGRTKYIEVQVKTTDDTPLPDKPQVTVAAAQEGHVTATPWSASDFLSNSSTFTMGFAVKASPDAREGARKVNLLAAAGPARVERTLDIVVKPVRRKQETRPAPALQLVLPDRVELVAGRAGYVEVQVRTSDSSPLPSEPSVEFLASDKDLHAARWTASPTTNGQSVYTVGLAITTPPNASAGERSVKIAASAGASKTEQTLKIRVKSPSLR